MRAREHYQMNLFWHRCRVTTFKVQYSAYQSIFEIGNSKLRASTYQLYRWICAQTELNSRFSAQSKEIQRATGLSERAIINARRELERLSLISTDREGGPGGGY